jgi:hypothetical protein
MLTDQQLLREYAERTSEAAFTEVVRRVAERNEIIKLPPRRLNDARRCWQGREWQPIRSSNVKYLDATPFDSP